MKETRELLHEKLCEILGSRHVYFQPPESIKMEYPCIIYQLTSYDTKYADDMAYVQRRRWRITIVDKDPESPFVDKVMAMNYAYFDRFFTKDGLNQWSISLYF